MTRAELLAEAKRRYPLGTKFKCSNGNRDDKTYVNRKGSIDGVFTVYEYVFMGEPHNGVHSGNGWIYLYGKWATIVSDFKLSLNYLIL